MTGREQGKRMDARHVGHAFAPFTAQADAWRLRSFAKATGQIDPVYTDMDAARAAGHAGLPLPPTFLFCLESDAPEPNALLTLLGLDPGQRLLHAEQGFIYHRMAYCGDRLRFSQRLDQVQDKKGGALQFAQRSTRVTNQRNELVAELRQVIVAVHGDVPVPVPVPPAAASTAAQNPTAPVDAADAFPPLLTAAITRLDLALYAGASGDHNPVHVDIDSARRAGFDDVFAHGMLVMAHAARGLTAWTPQRRLRALQLRFKRITHIGDRLRCEGHLVRNNTRNITDHIPASTPAPTERASEALLHINLAVRCASGVLKASGQATVSAAG